MFVWTSLPATGNLLCTVTPVPWSLGPSLDRTIYGPTSLTLCFFTILVNDGRRFQLGDLKRDAIKNSMDEYMTSLIISFLKEAGKKNRDMLT